MTVFTDSQRCKAERCGTGQCAANKYRAAATDCAKLMMLFGCTLVFADVRAAAQAPTTQRNQSFEQLISQQTLRLEPVKQDGQQTQDERREPEDASDVEPKITNGAEESEMIDDPVDAESDNGANRQRHNLALSHILKLRKPITQIRIGASSDYHADRPQNHAHEVLSHQEPGLVTATGSAWQPPSRYPVSFHHRPLYFQQPDLERCGRTFQCSEKRIGCLQNAVSGFTFLVNTMVLPYRLATERPDCLVPHQGDCRACASTGYDIEPLEPGRCGWVSESAAIAGFTFLML